MSSIIQSIFSSQDPSTQPSQTGILSQSIFSSQDTSTQPSQTGILSQSIFSSQDPQLNTAPSHLNSQNSIKSNQITEHSQNRSVEEIIIEKSANSKN